MIRLLALFHYAVYRFEHFFGQPPRQLLRGRAPREEFNYRFDIALNTLFTRPDYSRELFNELLDLLKTHDFDEEWAKGREARIRYNLARLSATPEERIAHLVACLELMPGHYMAKELLAEAQRVETP